MKVVEVKKAEQQFKFGDKVKVISADKYSDVAVGEVGIVVNVFCDDEYSIKVHSESDYDYFKPEQLQLISEETINPHEKIVGRKYKVITGNIIFNVGEIITLTEDDGDDMPHFIGEEDDGYIDMSKVELLPEITSKPAVGQKYVIISERAAGHSCAGNKEPWQVGKVITVVGQISNITARFTAEDGVCKYMPFEFLKPLTETTVTLELTVAELQSFVTAIGSTNVADMEDSANFNGYPKEVAGLAEGLYNQIKKTLKEAV